MRFLLILLVLAGCASSDTHYLKLGTGSQVGVYYAAGLAITDKVNEVPKLDMAVEATAGSVYNLNALLAGQIDFGFAQADRQYQAYFGEGPWDKKPQKKLRAICSLYTEAVTIVANEEIRSLKALKNKRVNLGPPGSGTRGNALDLLREVGLREEIDFDAEGLKPSEASTMLQDGRIDAFFYTVGHPNGSLTEATNGGRKVQLLPVTGMRNLLSKRAYYIETTIPIKHYPRALNQRDVPTVGMLTTLVTTEDVGEEVVYQVTKALFEGLGQLKAMHPSFEALKEEEMVEGNFAPLHPGALRYYKEVGLI